MHQVSLTTKGKQLAEQREAADPDQFFMYPPNIHRAGQNEFWTVADDLLVLLLGPTKVLAESYSYRHQLAAVTQSAAAIHSRADIVASFRTLCQDDLVDCSYEVLDSIIEAANIFKALSNPIRLELVRTALQGPVHAGTLKEAVGRSSHSVYHHLSILVDEGLVYSLGHGEGYVTDSEFVAGVLEALIEFFMGDDDGR